MSGRFAAGIKELLGRAGAFANDRRGRMAVLREFRSLPANERGRLLEEAGLDYREFVGAMQTPFISEDLNARALRAIGADADEFRLRHVEWSRDMQRLCMACTARNRCRRDLANDVFGRQYRHYCSNAGSIDEIVAGAV